MSDLNAQPWMTTEDALAMLTAPGRAFAIEERDILGRRQRVFAHIPQNLRAFYALAMRFGDRTFLVYGEERYSFAATWARVSNLAAELQTRFSVQPGDRVALAMRNYPEWCFTYLAVTSLGAVIVPLNGWWKGSELLFAVQDSGARVIVADAERMESLMPLLRGDYVCIVARASASCPPTCVPMDGLLTGQAPLPQVDIPADSDAAILYTSGSTGEPKGVVSTHRAVLSAVFAWDAARLSAALGQLPPELLPQIESWLALGPDAFASEPFALPQRSMLLTLPLFHVTGCNAQLLTSFRSGRKLVMMRKWNPEVALELIERERITDFNGVPTMSWELVNSPDFDKRDTSSLESLGAGGAARPPSQVRRLTEAGPMLRAGLGYGMTETNGLASVIGGDEYLLRPDSVGRPVPPLVEIHAVDALGHALPPNAEGELCIRSPSNMRGYWNRPEATATTLREGFVHSGDLGRVCPEGYVYITGRIKDIIIRGGENISCYEVEHSLHRHPAVLEAVVFGLPDERLGEVVGATVRVRPEHEVTVEALLSFLQPHLAAFKVPCHIWLQQAPLPRLAAEKIDRRAVRRQAERDWLHAASMATGGPVAG